MSETNWTLIDVERDLYVDHLELGPAELGPAAQGCSVRLRTLRGGLREGLQLLEIDNGAFRTALLPGRGMGVWKCYHAGETLGWNSPVRGPVHPAYVPVTEPSGLGWLDGFDELLVRCGLSSFGAPDHNAQGQLLWPLHGRIANLPAHWLSVSVDRQTGEIEVIGVVDESRFHFQKLRLTSTLRTLPGEPGVRIHDVVENLSANPAQMQLLYHVNLGQPLLEPGSRVVVPAAEVSPRDTVATTNLAGWETYGPPTPGSTESAYFFQLRGDSNCDTRVLLKNAGGDRGASLGFNLRQMPYFTLWKNTPGEADGYVTGLEPGTGFPNTRTHEEAQHRVVELPPGGRAEFDLSLTSHADAAAVAEAEQAVAELSEPGPLRIHPQPKPGWTVG